MDPVPRYPLKINGVDHATSWIIGGTKPIYVTQYANVYITIGVRIKGMANMGFRTIGIPKLSTSFKLKITVVDASLA